MTWTSIIAIYLLFWVMTAFVILPIGVRTHEELGLPKVPGQADSAPGNFQPRDRKSTRLNSSHSAKSRMPSSA